jgi:hypothetical protein
LWIQIRFSCRLRLFLSGTVCETGTIQQNRLSLIDLKWVDKKEMRNFWVDKKEMRNFFNFFSTYSIKAYKLHIILIQNGSFSLITLKLKSFKSIKIDIFFWKNLDILKNQFDF